MNGRASFGLLSFVVFPKNRIEKSGDLWYTEYVEESDRP